MTSLGGLLISETRYLPHAYLPRHWHATASLSLILRGDHRETIGSRTFARSRHTAVLKAPSLEHANQVGPRGSHALFVEISAAAVDSFVEATGRPITNEYYVDDATRQLVRRIGHELTDRQPGCDLMIDGLLLELLATVGRRRAARAPRPWLRRALEYLQANYRTSVAMSDVAAHAGVHPAHLAAVFRQHYAMSVGEWVRNQRLEFARCALSDRSHPISEIALEAGFADQSHLTRAFRLRFGASPSEYRRTLF